MRPWSVVACAAVLAWSSLAAADALDRAPFTATPAELLAAARPALGVDAPVVVLRDEATVTLDDRGRATTRYRVVAVIVKPAAVDDWGTLHLDWKPFYQDRSAIRARVIAPDGTVAELDPALVSDAPAKSASPSIFSDRRVMEAPLPRLAVGAVFEEEFVIVDREPLLGAGTVSRVYVGRGVPVRRAVVTIDAPARGATRVVARGFATAPTPRQTTSGGRTRWTYDLRAVAVDADRVFAVPEDVAAYRYVAYATAPSWAAVAADYQRVVADRTGAAFALPAGIQAATPRATVDRAVAWLHANVRYTGIELADSAIIPWSPAQTLARGFGDCKDKATLLVAVLRAAGLEADLALLWTGPGSDLDRDLPGMGPFDHAIVRARVDGKDLWIDATEDGLAAGQLPSRDQGRQALIIAPGTRALVTTPVAAPADNLVREVRTYRLAELDQAAVTEVTREHGAYADNLRRWFRDTPRADVTKDLRAYATRQYAGELTRVTGSPSTVVTEPFDLTVEVAQVGRAFTGREQIDVYLFPAATTTRVPDTLTADDADLDADLATRTMDYVWAVPHAYEIEHRLVLPPGYVAPTLTAREQQALGTMTLTTTRRLDRDTLVITYRLDTGKRRITPAELRATRAAMRKLDDAEGEHIVISQTGATLMHAGKLVEAIAEYRRLIALHPTEAVHHGQLAEAYRRAGMHAAARRAARQGVAVEPTSADAHNLLAFHLRRDSVGRDAGFDADRAGAIAAYRQALTLTPTHIGALEDYAALLAIDARGWPTGSVADLRASVALLRRARDATATDAYDQTISERLLLAGDFAAAEAAARAMPDAPARSAVLTAAVAAQRGGAAALALAGSLASGAARDDVLIQAQAWLMLARRYDALRALHGDVARRRPDPTRDALIARLTAVDPRRLPVADPTTPVILATLVYVALSPPARPWSTELDAELEAAAKQLSPTQLAALRTMPPALTLDLMVAGGTLTADGNTATGWRVTHDNGFARSVFYVSLDKGRAQLVGIANDAAQLGRTLRAALARKDLAGAARLMQRAVDDLDPRTAPPALQAAAALYRDEVTATRPASRELLDVATALLLADSQPASAIPVLRRCPVTHAATLIACRVALAAALRKREQWTELATVARTLPIDDAVQLAWRADALALAGAPAEAAALVDQALRTSPGAAPLLLERTLLSIDADGWDAAAPRVAQLLAHPSAALMLNNLAWIHLFHDPTPTRARALGERLEREQPSPSPAAMNTLAAIAAEAGEPFRALGYLEQARRHRLNDPPDAADWYVYGRIAEHYGLRDDAIAAYRRVGPEPRAVGIPSVHDFAQRALARLGVAPPRP